MNLKQFLLQLIFQSLDLYFGILTFLTSVFLDLHYFIQSGDQCLIGIL